MLIIRQAQMDALTDAAIRAFEDRTYNHLQKYFPTHCRLLGKEQMRRVIQHGWTKAKSYDLTPECCVRSYIEFMCLLGSAFDVDPLLPWAAEILNDRSMSDPVARGDRLYDRAYEYISHLIPDYRDATGKPITSRFVVELRLVRQEPDESLTLAEIPDLSSQLLARLQSVFRAKCQYVGDQRICGIISTAIDKAAVYGIIGKRGVTLFTVLMFVLGRGFDNDLLLPWASATLNDETITEQKKRVDKLYMEGVGFLRRWWDSAHGPVA